MTQIITNFFPEFFLKTQEMELDKLDTFSAYNFGLQSIYQ
jgi:hypothetical protein